jgi:hypothetical protein
MKKIIVIILSLGTWLYAFSQQLPQGAVVYALPMTSIKVSAEATHEVFTAGPYAKFASKYLGLEAATENKETYSLKSIEIQSFVEADNAHTYTVVLKDNKSSANFLAMSSTGLVSMFENNTNHPVAWRFASDAKVSDFNNRGHEPYLAKQTTTFYRTERTRSGLERVPVQQSQVVEKNIERRAEETANTIFGLRKKRMELISGDTDNPLTGDAMRAALEEIARLEEEYMSLFTGRSSYDTQSMTFEVIPDIAQPKQLYIAFRFSDTQGLLLSSNIAGRPVVLELTPEKNVQTMLSNDFDTDSKNNKRVSYRIPEIVQVRLVDGQNTLIQTRFPVYQLGRVMTFPIDLLR